MLQLGVDPNTSRIKLVRFGFWCMIDLVWINFNQIKLMVDLVWFYLPSIWFIEWIFL